VTLSTHNALARAFGLRAVAAAVAPRRTHALYEPSRAEKKNEKRRSKAEWDSRLLFEEAKYVRDGLLAADLDTRSRVAFNRFSTTYELALLCNDPDPVVASYATRSLRLVSREIERERKRRRDSEKYALARDRQLQDALPLIPPTPTRRAH
jgi:hypothetical protein